jgi:hypothetical protein
MLWFEMAPLAIQVLGALLLVSGPALLIHGALLRSATLRDWCQGSKDPLVATIALFFSLNAGFTASEVSGLFERCQAEVVREATNLDAAMRRLGMLGPALQKQVTQEIQAHLRYVVDTEWPLMAHRAATIELTEDHLERAIVLVTTHKVRDPDLGEAKRGTLHYLDEARNARNSRVVASWGAIHPLKWFLLLALVVLLQMAMAIIHPDTPKARLVTLLLLAASQATFLVVIFAFNHAFGGDVTVDPEPLKALIRR